MEISQKWLGEGAKGVLDPGGKGLPRVFCTTQTLFCTGATLFCTSARRLWRPGSKTPFAPSPNDFWEISIFGPSPRTLGSQPSALSPEAHRGRCGTEPTRSQNTILGINNPLPDPSSILHHLDREELGPYPPTRNYYENNSLRIIFRNF